MKNTVEALEALEGCMCEYISEDLRVQVETVAELSGAHEAQVLNLAIQIGLAVLLGKVGEWTKKTPYKRHGKMKLKNKPTLTGKGV